MTQPFEIPVPFAEARAVVLPAWIDYNGHLNVGYYHVAFDAASEPFFEFLGFTPEYRAREQATTFALEAHMNFLREVREGDPLRFESRLVDFDAKRVHYYQEMFHATDGYLAASHESVSSQVSLVTRRTAPMGEAMLARLGAIRNAHAKLETPWQLGHVISAHPPARR